VRLRPSSSFKAEGDQINIGLGRGTAPDIFNDGLIAFQGAGWMTPEDRRVISSLVAVPGRGRRGSPEEVLRHFGSADGRALGLRLLRDAVERQDGMDVEMALIVCATFGFTMDHLGPLVLLASADWHHKHEDVVSALGRLRSPTAVEALYHAAWWVPDYLDFDESRALAVKAIWALGGTPGREAEHALNRLLSAEGEAVRDAARTQLARREEREPRQ
jgi:hypothetical protein